MPSLKKKNNKKKLLKGGKSCPTGSQKVCIKKGDLIKLLKKAAVNKKTKTRKLKKTKLAKTRTKPVEKNQSFLGSIFGSKEEEPKVVPKAEKEPNVVVEPAAVETAVVETAVVEPATTVEPAAVEETATVEPAAKTKEEKPKKETSFLGSIFGSSTEPATPPAK